MIRSTVIDLNLIELINFFMSLNKCNGGCNVIDNLSTKICVPSKTKDRNIRLFITLIRKNEVKTLIEHIFYVILNENLMVEPVVQIKKMEKWQSSV